MRDFLLRFPHLGQSIFEIVGDENLTKCKTVRRSWSSYMDEERFFWKQIIKKLVHDYDDFRKDWNVAMKKSDIEMLKELGQEVSFNSSNTMLFRGKLQPQNNSFFSFTFVCRNWSCFTL